MTDKEKNILLHTLGHTGYRNYFVADEGHADWSILESLVGIGCMWKRTAPFSPGFVFHVTELGQKEIGVHYQKD